MLAQAETIQPPATGLIVREATPADGEHCGRIFYGAFESIATRHNHPIEPPSREFTRFMVGQDARERWIPRTRRRTQRMRCLEARSWTSGR